MILFNNLNFIIKVTISFFGFCVLFLFTLIIHSCLCLAIYRGISFKSLMISRIIFVSQCNKMNVCMNVCICVCMYLINYKLIEKVYYHLNYSKCLWDINTLFCLLWFDLTLQWLKLMYCNQDIYRGFNISYNIKRAVKNM